MDKERIKRRAESIQQQIAWIETDNIYEALSSLKKNLDETLDLIMEMADDEGSEGTD